MLESINIKQVASYDDTGIQITGLKKVNFIYGANGCGKTTISNFLHNIDDVAFPNCEVTWKNTTQIKTLVYNKQFRERNYGKGKLGGIFTLGEATADEITVIETKVEQLKVIKTEVVSKSEALLAQKSRLEVLENDLKEDAWTKVYKKYETVFNEAFDGSTVFAPSPVNPPHIPLQSSVGLAHILSSVLNPLKFISSSFLPIR